MGKTVGYSRAQDRTFCWQIFTSDNVQLSVAGRTYIDDVNPRGRHFYPRFVVACGHLEQVIQGLLNVLGSGQVSVQSLNNLSLATETRNSWK